MATIKRFEDLEVWQLARELNKRISPILDKLNETKNFDLKSQLDRSAGSVMDNISEGFERDGNREFIQFLAISKGSLGEVRSQLYRVLDRDIIDVKTHEDINAECLLLATKISKFITYLNGSIYKGNKFKSGKQPETTN
ncbi:MAG TPA: four helix bundle protein [Bacteroidia bacterium]|nr:four helix bundle protein [Bacteroidia bacterium]